MPDVSDIIILYKSYIDTCFCIIPKKFTYVKYIFTVLITIYFNGFRMRCRRKNEEEISCFGGGFVNEYGT